ncbi:MAG: hypothetical protein ABSF91_07665 [Bacteroidota bacterium]|jgi:REP element-mobilizing transposase RayT
MPNHVNGIIIINDDTVGSRHASTLRGTNNTLGNIVGSFKSAVTKRVNEIRKTPSVSIWQPRYYDHIIRNEKSLNRIREYINTNPQQWVRDKENAKCNCVDEFDRWLIEQGRQKMPLCAPKSIVP